jgi:molybdopterin molybdotransferase
MMGRKDLFKDVLTAEAVSPISKRKGRSEFKRGRMWRDGPTLLVDLTGPQGSGILTSLVRGNCLIHLDYEREEVVAGEEVSIIPF